MIANEYSYNSYNQTGQFSKAFNVFKIASYNGFWGAYPSQYQLPTPLGW